MKINLSCGSDSNEIKLDINFLLCPTYNSYKNVFIMLKYLTKKKRCANATSRTPADEDTENRFIFAKRLNAT